MQTLREKEREAVKKNAVLQNWLVFIYFIFFTCHLLLLLLLSLSGWASVKKERITLQTEKKAIGSFVVVAVVLVVVAVVSMNRCDTEITWKRKKVKVICFFLKVNDVMH